MSPLEELIQLQKMVESAELAGDAIDILQSKNDYLVTRLAYAEWLLARTKPLILDYIHSHTPTEEVKK